MIGKTFSHYQILEEIGRPLRAAEMPRPTPGPEEVLIRVRACAVCRTDLHVVDGELPDPKLPLVPGHEIVGTVEATGREVARYKAGDRVGVPWLGYTCNRCPYCRGGAEDQDRHAVLGDGFLADLLLDGFDGFAFFQLCQFGDIEPAVRLNRRSALLKGS